MARQASLRRETSETRIALTLAVDGEGRADAKTGIGFLDHMLTLFARHGCFDLAVEAAGDLEVDFHHTVEDTGIALGQAFAQALGEKRGIRRYGCAHVPMDESLVRCVIDLSGRAFLAYEAPASVEPVGGNFSFQLVEEFLRAFATNCPMNLHVAILAGRDAHHMAEGVFKALARAMDEATTLDPRLHDLIPSTKGVL